MVCCHGSLNEMKVWVLYGEMKVGVEVPGVIFDGGEERGEILVEMSSGKNHHCDF